MALGQIHVKLKPLLVALLSEVGEIYVSEASSTAFSPLRTRPFSFKTLTTGTTVSEAKELPSVFSLENLTLATTFWKVKSLPLPAVPE
jgi:hypothetical protein